MNNKIAIRDGLLSLLFALLTIIPVSAKSQQNDSLDGKNISLNYSGKTLSEIFEIISDKTGVNVTYGEYILNKKEKKDISYNSKSLRYILDGLGAENNFTYTVKGNVVYITEKNSQQQKQQKQQISGIVKDSDGLGMPGVSVVVKESLTGTSTDFDGNFTIEVAQGETLEFSFIGYATQTIVYTGQTSFDIVLEEDAQVLADVVVVGYGVQKKSVVTGAISSVKTEELTERPIANATQALQGKVSGVVVTQNSGSPGSPMSVRIRGVGSSGSNEPLYIVDGIPASLENINPSDIASIEILKDAASGAIYGSRAANGVVLVTTKKGKEGKVTVSYDGYFGVQNPWKKLELPNSYEYMNLYNEMMVSDGLPPVFSNNEILSNKVDTDWQDEVFVKNAPISNHHVQLTGGTKASSFILSAGYFTQDGIIGAGKSDYNKFTFRINSSHEVSKYIKIGENLSYMETETRGIDNQNYIVTPLTRTILTEPTIEPYVTEPFEILEYESYPISPVIDSKNGLYYTFPRVDRSPLAWLEMTNNQSQGNSLFGDVYIEISNVVEGLKFRSDYGFTKSSGFGRSYQPYVQFTRTDATPSSSVGQSASKGNIWQWENILSYNTEFGKSNFSALVGSNISVYNGEYVGGGRTGLNPDGWDYAWLNNGVGDGSQTSGGGYWESRMLSYFSRLMYDYDEKYMLSVTMRADGSSKFGPDNRFGYFPSFSAGWMISRENFMENIESVDVLKLRASWGQVGNDAIGNFTYMPSIVSGWNYPMGLDGNLTPSLVPGSAANTALKWETSEQTNIGLDMEMFRSRLLINAEFYQKKTKDLLAIEPIPGFVGVSSPISNVGEIVNQGIELELGVKNSVGDFNYHVSALASYNQNKVNEVGNTNGYINGTAISKEVDGSLRMEMGEVFPFFYGYDTNGIFQNWEEVENYTNKEGLPIQPDAVPGDIRFVDVDGDGFIGSNDRVKIGQVMPDWTFGLNVSMEYRNFDFTMQIQGQTGNSIANISFLSSEEYSIRSNRVMYDRWHGEGTTHSHPRLSLVDANKNYRNFNSMLHLEDGSFARLKNLQIGYTLPDNLLKGAGVSHFRIYINAQNLFTLTRYTGFDPEIGSGNVPGAYLDYGVDRAAYPQSRTITTGVSVNF